MDRKSTDRRIRVALAIIYLLIILTEVILIAIGNSHNQMELLTVSFSFPQLIGIVLIMDIPLFVSIAIAINAIKEIAYHLKSHEKGNTLLKLSSTSGVLLIITVMLFVATCNTVTAVLSDALYLLTLVFALSTVVVFAVYLIQNKKLG